MTLQFTGERFLPECKGEMVYEHWHRYLLAARHVQGLRVLDVASGEGYGSSLLAATASEVVGVDISPEAVAHAQQRYGGPNLRYVAASCTDIPEPDASFDVIVSFETIEHIDGPAQAQFLQQVNRLLKPGGLFILSSPNRPEYSEKTGFNNEFHVKELDQAELQSLLTPHFPAQRWFAQKASFQSMLWPLDRAAQQTEALNADGGSRWPDAVYFLVFCARDDSRLSAVDPIFTLVSDHDDSVYAEWARTYKVNAELHRLNQSLEAEVKQLRARLGPASEEPLLVRIARMLSGQ